MQGSLDMLHAMLQTDPKKRITVKEMLHHPWLMDGYEKPVKWQSKYVNYLNGTLNVISCDPTFKKSFMFDSQGFPLNLLMSKNDEDIPIFKSENILQSF